MKLILPTLKNMPDPSGLSRLIILPGNKWKSVCFLLLILTGCSGIDGKIIDNTFFQNYRGYQFNLPGEEWEIDKDAWAHSREFGHITYRGPQRIVYRRQPSNPDGTSGGLQREVRLGQIKTRIFFNIDVGFLHKTYDMSIRAASIPEWKLLKYLYWKSPQPETLSRSQMIAQYFQRYANRPGKRATQPATVTIENLPDFGEVHRFQQTTEQSFQVIYGIPLQREYLFFAFEADSTTPEKERKQGLDTFQELIEKKLMPL